MTATEGTVSDTVPTTQETPCSTPCLPTMPYRVEDRPYGRDGRLLPTKIYPLGGGMLLTTEELQVMDYIRWLEAERDRLQAFKDYVHKRLDEAGVPADPESPHKSEGCRIGGRLDVVFAVVDLATRDETPLGPTEFIPHDDEPKVASEPPPDPAADDHFVAPNPKAKGKRNR